MMNKLKEEPEMLVNAWIVLLFNRERDSRRENASGQLLEQKSRTSDARNFDRLYAHMLAQFILGVIIFTPTLVRLSEGVKVLYFVFFVKFMTHKRKIRHSWNDKLLSIEP